MQPAPSSDDFSSQCQQIAEQGFAVFPDVLSTAEVATYRAALQPWLDSGPLGRNVFEGTRTHRVYAMLAKDPVFAELVMHPMALAFAEHFLGESCLLSACLAIDLQPGESAQPWHTDDGHTTLAPPHDMLGVSTFWALDDTTVDNGATEVLPGSHRWSEQEFPGVLKPGDFSTQTNPKNDEDPGFQGLGFLRKFLVKVLPLCSSTFAVFDVVSGDRGASGDLLGPILATPWACGVASGRFRGAATLGAHTNKHP